MINDHNTQIWQQFHFYNDTQIKSFSDGTRELSYWSFQTTCSRLKAPEPTE